MVRVATLPSPSHPLRRFVNSRGHADGWYFSAILEYGEEKKKLFLPMHADVRCIDDATHRIPYLRYADFEYLKSIVVVWNAIDVAPPTIKDSWFRIPVNVVISKENSMNNRFKPSNHIGTDCVINMDDDWDMPYPVMEYAIRVWHGGYQDALVGLWDNGRVHGVHRAQRTHRDAAAGGGDGRTNGRGGVPPPPPWTYGKVEGTQPRSIVLPSGMVYHRRYLKMYTEDLPHKARALVDRVTNCDDILFNFMVANATGNAPVFIGTDGITGVQVMQTVTADGEPSGLYNRKEHAKDRGACLATFSDMFAGMKLRYVRQSPPSCFVFSVLSVR